MGSGLVAATPAPAEGEAAVPRDGAAEPAPKPDIAVEQARRVAEAEALLATSGLELYRDVLDLLRAQLAAGKVNPVLATLLAQARSALLRGLRQPEKITRPAAGEERAPGRQGPAREGGTFDFAAFARLFQALAGSGAASEDAAGADGPDLALDSPRADP